MTERMDQAERRRWRRLQVPFPGKLFGPSGGSWNCEVLDITPGGARVEAPDFRLRGACVLYVNRIGRVEAEIVREEGRILCLQFRCSEAERQAIAQVLNQMVQGGVAQMTRLRRQPRMALTKFHFLRDNGAAEPCDALDMSARGMSLKTAARPPLGEFVTIGHSRGRVVRHHAEGIAIEFVPSGSGAVVRFPGSGALFRRSTDTRPAR